MNETFIIMDIKEIDFIARHYKKGKFSVNAGWRRLGIARSSGWKRFRIAAAVSAVVILSATAAILYNNHRVNDMPQQTAQVPAVSPLAEVKVIDFENAPLPEVIAKIESVYGVKINDIPESPEEYTLSLHYEGTPTDLISVINDILDTHMSVTEQ